MTNAPPTAAEKRALLARKLRERSEAPRAYPLSTGQRRMYFLDQLVPGVPLYNVVTSRRLTGSLDIAALRRALERTVARHATLRTTFPDQGGEPIQLVAPTGVASLDEVDLSAAPGSPQERAQRFADERARQQLDLRTGPVLRASLGRLGPDDHVLVFNVHHIVCDAWSVALLWADLRAFYLEATTGQPADPPALRTQYGDFAVRQRDLTSSDQFRRDLAYWTEHLAGAPTLLALPTDRPRPAAQTYRGAVCSTTLPEDFAKELEAFASTRGCTTFMVLLAGYAGLLGRLAGQQDVVVGTPIAGRDDPDLEHVVGFFAGTLALRMSITDDPVFTELLAGAREAITGGLAHADLPFERLVEHLQPDRNMAHSPIFQAQLVLQNVPDQPLNLPGIEANLVIPDPGVAKFDITLVGKHRTDGGLLLSVEYSTDLFDGETIQRLIDRLVALLRAAMVNPNRRLSELDGLSGMERWQVVNGFNSTAIALPAATTALDLVRPADPGMPAVIAADGDLTYAELDERANRLAHLLREAGIGPDVPVGICLDRGSQMLVAVLAVWKAGGCYLPLDPSWPVERLRLMLQDADVPVLISHQPVRQRLGELTDSFGGVLVCLDDRAEDIAERPATPPSPADLSGEHRAYLIYTSGSTGRPKGVEVPHRAVVNLLVSFADLLNLGATDVLAAVTTLSFDISVLELLAPLTGSARVLIVDSLTTMDGPALRRALVAHEVTAMQATPATWRMLLEAGGPPAGVQMRLCGGETLPRDLADALLAGDDEPLLWNVYGPTETTVWSAAGLVDPAPAPVVVGPPIGNTQIYVLDARLEPVPVGVVGELYIGGHGVARGYHGRPGLTAEKFLPDPFSAAPSARMYATGDLARFRRDGTLEFLGRGDHQVKVRGFRIELGEIEAVLRADPLVREAVVVAWGTSAADTRLVAYLVPREPGTASAVSEQWSEIRARAQRSLPEYMVPVACTVLDVLPLTPNGKVDRRALPQVRWRVADVRRVPPRDAVETVLAGIWREVLDTDEVGVHDDFFALGGHSLLVAKALSGVRSTLRVEVPLRTFFADPTVAGLAVAMADLESTPGLVARHAAETLQLSSER